jgi:ribosomal protein L6P/L9E
MKTILAMETMDIPKAVTVKVAAKVVTVEGARGKLTRNFKHLNLDFQLQDSSRSAQICCCWSLHEVCVSNLLVCTMKLLLLSLPLCQYF